MTFTEQIKSDFNRLHNQGVKLYNAMQVEQFGAEMEHHFTTVLKQDFAAFKKGLPNFTGNYQAWFSEAQIVVAQYLPGRLSDFNSLYEAPKARKEIRKDNYVIEDYLRGTTKMGVELADAIPLMQQQLAIFDTIQIRLDSYITETRAALYADVADQSLMAATELLKNGFTRSAGALCGVVVLQHLEQLRMRLKNSRRFKSLKEANETLQKADIYEFAVFRQIQYVSDLYDLSVKNKKAAPTEEQIADMLDIARKLLKTVH